MMREERTSPTVSHARINNLQVCIAWRSSKRLLLNGLRLHRPRRTMSATRFAAGNQRRHLDPRPLASVDHAMPFYLSHELLQQRGRVVLLPD